MQYKQLGRTRLEVSRICLGTWNWAWHTSEPDSHIIMNHALEKGVNFFDTANVYGGEINGRSEQSIGNWLAEEPARRDRIVLATKLYGPMGDGPNDKRLSAYHIRKACEDSLMRLKTDRIDLYQMHHVDRSAPWEEIWQAMDILVQQGKVIYIGSSNFAGWDIATANQIAKQRNALGLVSEQSVYNLAKREVELEVLPACEHYGVGVIPWSPLWGGMLGGTLEKASKGRRSSEHAQQRIEKHRDQLERYEKLCGELNHHPAHVALAWLLANPVVTAPIIGPRTLEQFSGSLPALEVELDEQTMNTLDNIWPGPGGSAPEAYAW